MLNLLFVKLLILENINMIYKKKQTKLRKNKKLLNLKEIKLRPVTDVHDYNFKIKNAQKFLQKVIK